MNSENIIRDMARADGISFGTSAPCAIGSKVRMNRVGFADLAMAELTVYCRRSDVGALTPIARQRVYRALETNGIPSSAVSFVPSVGSSGRSCLFTDDNPQSVSHGKRKRGEFFTFRFEFADRSWFNHGQTLACV